MSKGTFDRPLRVGEVALAHEGGRVTELAARPLLNLCFPQLAGFDQPLAGEIAIRRDVMARLPIPVGYGVEIAMLIDAWRHCGLEALCQVDLGTRHNRHQSLRELSAMAYAVMAAAAKRSEVLGGAGHSGFGPLLLPARGAGEPAEVRQVAVEERPPFATL
jgi:glucosyl-3-phosphoglycerate synthase